ncbi:MAG: hypothetical protein OHK0038_21900 [Flammeovirgaceae bacterium]
MKSKHLLIFNLLIFAQLCLAQGAKTPFAGASITIYKGNKVTNDIQIELEIRGEGAVQMMISNDQDFVGANWIPYAVQVPRWHLDPADGIKKVYCKLKDKDGNESQVFSDDIVLDTTPPEHPKVEIDYPSEYFNVKSLEVGLKISAVGARYVMISNHESFYGCQWRAFQEDYYDWKLEEGDDGHRFVYVKFKDVAGNESNAVHDHIILDTTPPTGIQVLIDNGSAFTYQADKKVKLYLDAKGADSVMISNNSAFKDSKWEVYNPVIEWFLEGENGEKTVYVKYKDKAGNLSSVYNGKIILDSTPPKEGKILIDGGAAQTSQIDKLVTLTFTADPDVEQMLVSNLPSFQGAKWRTFVPKITDWKLGGDEKDGDRTVYVKFKDKAGNISSPLKATIKLKRGF